MDFRQIRYFVEIARRGSFLKAAESLGLSQPALSRQIALLERELEVSLFDRNSGGVSLTESGHRLRTRSVELLELWSKTESEVKRQSESLSGSYTIVAGGTAAAYILPPVLRKIRMSRPVNFKLFEGDVIMIQEYLNSGAADLGIATGTFADAQLYQRKFVTDEIVPVCAKNHAMARVRKPSVDSVLSQDLVLFHSASAVRRLVEARIRRLRPEKEINPSMELQSVDTVLKIVSQGLGIGFVSRYAAGSLHVLNAKELFIERELHFAYRKNRGGISSLIDAIENAMGKDKLRSAR